MLTVEDHSVVGGLGTIVAETVARRRAVACSLDQVALPDEDLEVGVPAELYEYYGLTPAERGQQGPQPGQEVTTAMREPLLDPTGDGDRGTNTRSRPRPQSLAGLTVGLLDNAKPNGAVLLRAVGRELQEKYGVREVRMFRKGYFGTPVEESVVQQMLHNCDFAVAAIGD